MAPRRHNAKAGMGPLTEPRRRAKSGSRLRQSVSLVLVLRRSGTLAKPLYPPQVILRLDFAPQFPLSNPGHNGGFLVM